MQTDLDLLQQTLGDGRPRWRFYVWDQPTLSLGRHQTWGGSLDLPKVQRPTGGRAVLHGAGVDLTYALTWKADPHLSRHQVYAHLCQILIRSAAHWGIPLTLGGNRSYHRHPSCFASHTHADLTWGDYKVIGSAQLWQQGTVLQHGTILLAPDYPLWNQILPGSPIRGLQEIAVELHHPPPSPRDLCQTLHHYAHTLLT